MPNTHSIVCVNQVWSKVRTGELNQGLSIQYDEYGLLYDLS